jgi:hypothetical protein
VLSVRVALEHSVRDIDAPTRSRLTQMRHAALDRGLARRYRMSTPVRWMTAGALVVVLAVLALPGRVPDETPVSVPVATPAPPPLLPLAPSAEHAAALSAPDFDLLSDAEQVALLQDLEFYTWLDEVDVDEG